MVDSYTRGGGANALLVVWLWLVAVVSAVAGWSGGSCAQGARGRDSACCWAAGLLGCWAAGGGGGSQKKRRRSGPDGSKGAAKSAESGRVGGLQCAMGQRVQYRQAGRELSGLGSWGSREVVGVLG